jgi:hypothetical protein
MNQSTAVRPGRSLHLPPQAAPIRRVDDSSESAMTPAPGVEAAGCGDLTGMARELCYASQHGLYF